MLVTQRAAFAGKPAWINHSNAVGRAKSSIADIRPGDSSAAQAFADAHRPMPAGELSRFEIHRCTGKSSPLPALAAIEKLIADCPFAIERVAM
jgi:hypothetical protein